MTVSLSGNTSKSVLFSALIQIRYGQRPHLLIQFSSRQKIAEGLETLREDSRSASKDGEYIGYVRNKRNNMYVIGTDTVLHRTEQERVNKLLQEIITTVSLHQ